MSDNILTKDELSVILYWATIADIHGLAGDNAEIAAKLRRMRDESSVEPLPVAPMKQNRGAFCFECKYHEFMDADKEPCYTCLERHGEKGWDHPEYEPKPALAPGPGASDSNGGGA